MDTPSKSVNVTRRIAAVVGIFFVLATIGGFPLGVVMRDGSMLAIASLSAGIALACGLWWSWAREPILFKDLNVIALVSTTLTAGLALYSNLSYGIWALGMPMNIGTVANGRMGEHYWLGPLTLVYAVVSYLIMKMNIKKHRE